MANLLFLASFPIHPISGGVQRATQVLSQEFEKSGSKVLYLSIKGAKPVDNPEPRQFWLSEIAGSVENDAKRLLKWVVDHDIDIIINQSGIHAEVIDLAKYIKKTEIIFVTVHHNCVWCLNERYREIRLGNAGDSRIWHLIDRPGIWKILRFLNRKKYSHLFHRAIKVSDKLVLLSPIFIPELQRYGLNPSTNDVIAIPNPAPFQQVPEALQEKENRIIYVGRLVITQKRVDRLLEIWKELHHLYTDWYFDIVGDGPARKWMQDFCQENGLVRVKFYGHANPRPYLRRAKFFTLVSDFEGYGMVLVEAQAYGVVPLSFNCFSAISDIILNGETGLVIENFNASNYIQEADELMRNELKRQTMAKKAIKSIARYNAENVAAQWISLFNEIEMHNEAK